MEIDNYNVILNDVEHKIFEFKEYLEVVFGDDRTDHIKRFVWSILPYSQVSNNDQDQFFELIFCLANKHLSPDNPIQFKEFEASGFFFEIVDFRYKQVMIKRLSGLMGNLVCYYNNQASIFNSRKVVIPGQIYKNGLGNLLVTSIDDGLFNNLTQAETIEIPNTIMHVKWSFWNCTKLKSIEVKPCNSEYFCSINGVLFSGDKKTLFAYPNMHGKEYFVPEGVEKIGNCAFKDCILLEELHLPISITHIGINAFYRCDNLKRIVCAGSKDCIKVEGSFGASGKQEFEWIYTK